MSDSFIFELPLQIPAEQESVCHARFYAGCNLYNACLGEALKRLSLARQSKDWQQAKKLLRSKERSNCFRQALKRSQFSEYSLHAFVKNLVHECWIKDHIDSQVAQKIATRAFLSAHEYMLGKRGRPRFKNPKQFSSLERKSNLTGIRFKNGKIFWKKLILIPLYDSKDKVEAHALAHRTKYVRLVRRNLRGKPRFYAQLIQEGKSLLKKKHHIGKGKTIGLDIGPSTIAIVGKKTAHLGAFCSELKENENEIKKLQKALDRSRRSSNPDNYNEKGIPLKNTSWKTSNRARKKQKKLAEQKRIVAATRKTLHGTHANKVLSLANTIKCEKLSYKSFQRTFGKSVTKYAPGIFMQTLRRKAENAGGQVIEFSTYVTKLSQTCHECGVVKKKPLNQRWHICPCGIKAQRDLYSAFLALHVDNEHLDRSQAISAWASADSLLRQAVSRLEETAKDKQRLACFGLSQRQSRLPVEDGSATSEIKDVVHGTMRFMESFEELRMSCH
jgi:putative transposase